MKPDEIVGKREPAEPAEQSSTPALILMPRPRGAEKLRATTMQHDASTGYDSADWVERHISQHSGDNHWA